MKERSIRILMATVTAALVLASCTANGGAIYATIENAKKTITSTLAKTLTIQDLVAQAAGGPYDIAAGAIFEGAITGSPSTSGDIIQWKADASGNLIPIASPVSGQICSSLVLFGGKLWGAFFNPNAQTFGLYTSSTAPFSFAGQAPNNDPQIAGKQIMLIQVANGTLFVVAGAVTGSPYVFELDYFNGTYWVPLLTNLPYMINGVAWDGTNYWAAGGTTVYTFPFSFTPVSTLTSLGGYNLANAAQLNGVFIDGTGGLARIFIPSKGDGVYYSLDQGSTWLKYGPDNINSNTVGYLCVAGPVDAPSPAGNVYVVGADGWGYYYLNVTAPSVTRFNDSTILLYSAAVRRILVDLSGAGQNSVFMGTAGGGLWRSSFNNGAPDANGWIHE